MRLLGLLCTVFGGILLAACGPISQADFHGEKLSPSVTVEEAINAVEYPPASSYRIQFDVLVKESGEVLEFDFVVGCGGKYSESIFSDRARGYIYSPQMMFQATKTGEAVGVSVPRLCSNADWGLDYDGRTVIQNAGIPSDFLPRLLWYPDVNQLGFAFGYESDKAYESRYAKLLIPDRVKISRSDARQWMAWRRRAALDYKQVGAIPGPWGLYYGGASGSEAVRRIEVNQGIGIATPMCRFAKVVDVPESLQDELASLLADETSRYWASWSPPQDKDLSREISELLRANDAPLYNGGSFDSHRRQWHDKGVRRSTGKGRVNTVGDDGGNFYSEAYPFFGFELINEDASQDGPESVRYSIVIDEDWLGFSVCGWGHIDEPLARRYGLGELDAIEPIFFDGLAPISGENSEPLIMLPDDVYINDEHVVRHNSLPPTEFFVDVRDQKLIHCCTSK